MELLSSHVLVFPCACSFFVYGVVIVFVACCFWGDLSVFVAFWFGALVVFCVSFFARVVACCCSLSVALFPCVCLSF